MSTVVCRTREVSYLEQHAPYRGGYRSAPHHTLNCVAASSDLGCASACAASLNCLQTTMPVVSGAKNNPTSISSPSTCIPEKNTPSTNEQPSEPLPRAEEWADSVRVSRILHSRAKSAAHAGPMVATQAYQRVRAWSTAEQPRSTRDGAPRPRMLSSVAFPTKAPVHLHIATQEPVGAFTPTSCPRQSLQSLLAHKLPPARWLRKRTQSNVDAPVGASPSSLTPLSIPSSPTLPSICRTPSSYTASEYFPTAPSSAGPATPVHTFATLPTRKLEPPSLHPVLESLERSSRFRVQTACATCGKSGTNFPCCPRCGELWCSRVCRLKRGDGKRHICVKT
ncbi:hypothetical protein A0H81_11361 [Grifola frondosa]|uniref:Uncharacterized protein n=1 Tax=Grifola frondosa TaxID=5627 RepID=A0A1C7LVR6_GRIFR|nr:hypothetical protein A0H81_11361 [Grifola frondosa]